MTDPERLREIAALLRDMDLPQTALQLNAIAVRYARMERTLDEIVADSQEEALMTLAALGVSLPVLAS